MGFSVKDVLMKVTKALANGAANVTSDALDTMCGARGDQLANFELKLSAPAMNATEMPDAKTMKYDIIYSVNSDLSSPTTFITAAITQTGAGGVGCAAATFQFRPNVDGARYWGVKAIGSASGNATTASLTFEALF